MYGGEPPATAKILSVAVSPPTESILRIIICHEERQIPYITHIIS